MIWLIGGTSESVIIATLMAQCQFNFVISVTTDNARNLYESIPYCNIVVGKLSGQAIVNFLQQYHVKAIVDCSHPFATEISQSVITISQSLNLPYLRYERPEVFTQGKHLINHVPNLEPLLLDNSPLQGKRVLLTIGAKYLPRFKDFQASATLYTRILPYPESLELAYQGGFSCDRIMALRPPLSQELEIALWKLWQIEIVVSKAGGKAGGEEIKSQVAQALNIPLMIITRPQIDYPLVTSNWKEVREFICHNL
jgi:precorrin-6A/cobalt-precorrin-6A reductase